MRGMIPNIEIFVSHCGIILTKNVVDFELALPECERPQLA
jgi:hypothetical protein